MLCNHLSTLLIAFFFLLSACTSPLENDPPNAKDLFPVIESTTPTPYPDDDDGSSNSYYLEMGRNVGCAIANNQYGPSGSETLTRTTSLYFEPGQTNLSEEELREYKEGVRTGFLDCGGSNGDYNNSCAEVDVNQSEWVENQEVVSWDPYQVKVTFELKYTMTTHCY